MERDISYARWKEAGDPSAFAALIAELQVQLRRHAFTLVKTSDPEDVVQTVIMEAFLANRSTLPNRFEQWTKGLYQKLEWRATDANRRRVDLSLSEPCSDDENLTMEDALESVAYRPTAWRGQIVESAVAEAAAMTKTSPVMSEYLDLIGQGLSKQDAYVALSERHGGHWTTWKGRCLRYDRKLAAIASRERERYIA